MQCVVIHHDECDSHTVEVLLFGGDNFFVFLII